jgi:Spondin_N
MLSTLIALPGGTRAVSAQGTVYTVTIQNLTHGQPFTPPLLVAHTGGADVFEIGQAASPELQQIAENGNLDPMVALLEASSAVSSVVVGTGPVMPGASVSLTIEAEAGSSLSWVSMLICTNDGFTGIDSMPVLSASTTVETNAYDAGTEMNTENFADLVPPCQALVPVSSDDEGTGMTNPELAEGGVVMMHAGVKGGRDLTASHMWTDPVARVTITPGGAISPPSTGDGGLVDNSSATTLYVVGALLAIVAMGGAASYARQCS